MRLVIDSNRFIACFLRDSISRRILFDGRLEFCSPEYLITEIKKHKRYLAKKAKQTDKQFYVVLYSLLENITLIPYDEFKEEMEMAIKIMRDIDLMDAPFLAVGMALGVDGIWTEDKHFHKQSILNVYRTKGLVELLRMGGTR